MLQATDQQTATVREQWTLTERCDRGVVGQVLSIPPRPTLIGRTSDTPITLSCTSVSKRHAEIRLEEGRPVLSDLGSTNGTFVNGRPANDTPLAHGDVVQFASKVFRVEHAAVSDSGATMEGTALPFAAALLQFEELMSGAGVVPHFQPIVRLPDGKVEAYELLARSTLEELRNPAAMFSTAERLGQASALSELMRREGARDALRLPDCGSLFVNTHPEEVINDRFLNSLAELRELAPKLPITIEVHEAAITSVDDMKRLQEVLDRHAMQLAYDDFGAGQARLDELSDAPPACLKFDIKLVRGIDRAPPARLSMVRSLVTLTHELGITPLAEGVETAEEAAACHELGFTLAQGYFYGRPSPADQLV